MLAVDFHQPSPAVLQSPHLGRAPLPRLHDEAVKQAIICRYWLQNRCTRNPCPFAHTQSPATAAPDVLKSTTSPQRRPRAASSRSWQRADHAAEHPFSTPAPPPQPNIPEAHLTRRPDTLRHDKLRVPCTLAVQSANPNPTCRLSSYTSPKLAQQKASSPTTPPLLRRKLKRPSTWAPSAAEFSTTGSAHAKPAFGAHGDDHEQYPSQEKCLGHAAHIDAEAARPVPITALAPLPIINNHIEYTTSSTGIQKDSIKQHRSHQLLPALISTANDLGSTDHDQLQAAIKGMALPFSSDILFTISDDATLRAWGNMHQAAKSYTHPILYDKLCLPQSPSCLFNNFADPQWLFVGLPQEVRICNISSHTQQSLPVASPVLSITSLGVLLLAGLENGSILVWSFDAPSSAFHAVTCLNSGNHMSSTSPVLSLEPEATGSSSTTVYAGLANGTIEVWDIASGHCRQTVRGAHSGAVTQLLTCDHLSSLVSASQDGAIKLWKASTNGHQLQLQSTLINSVEKGLLINAASADCVGPIFCAQHEKTAIPLAVCGVLDGSTNAPLVFAAYDNSQLQILELPSLHSVGTILTKHPIRALDAGPSHTLLLGSINGDISVWKWK